MSASPPFGRFNRKARAANRQGQRRTLAKRRLEGQRPLLLWRERLAQRRLTLEVSLPAKKWLADRGFDPLYGARPLRRLIQQAIGDQLAKKLLAGEVHDGDVVPVNVSPDGDSLVLG